jgi:hypothetical protein
MRCALLAAAGSLVATGGADASGERPAWVRHEPAVYLAEAVAQGATLQHVAMLPRNPHDRLGARAGLEMVPVYFLTLRGRLLRCTDRADPEVEAGRVIPSPCDVAVVRSGLPWLPAAP